MNIPNYTIRIPLTEVFKDGAFVPMRDVQAECEKHNVEMQIISSTHFEFTTDDVKNLFLLGLNFPKQ